MKAALKDGRKLDMLGQTLKSAKIYGQSRAVLIRGAF